MNKNDSQRLFGRLRQALFEVDQIVGEIIESKAWEPLGYESFVDAWKPWSAEEDLTLLYGFGTDFEKSIELGRSFSSVTERRLRLKRKKEQAA